jgi:hypothetical protein
MSSERTDRQGEDVIAKGLDFEDFLEEGHFNDNHSPSTAAIVGYPEKTTFHRDLGQIDKSLDGVSGWTCEGYVLKGTGRADGIWELAKALGPTPKRLGFSIEGKVQRRKNKTIEKAKIRNVAITNCPVNTDCTWGILTKSFYDEDMATKALSAGFATSPSGQSDGGALRSESLEHDKDKRKAKKKEALERALGMGDLIKAMDHVLEFRPDFDDEAAAYFVTHLANKRGQ